MIIWIASYPKSGNTWLRALLSSYFYSKNGEFNFELLNNIDAFPSEKFFKNYPDKFNRPEDTCKYWINEQEKINKLTKYTFLKTHNALCKINNNTFTNNKNSVGAIYIVRDPRNLITSLSNHYQITTEYAFKFMIDEKKATFIKKEGRYVAFQPILSWSLNKKSWLENSMFPVLTIKYEELISETFLTFKKIITFINKITNSKTSIDRPKIINSIKNCEFNKLKKLEDKQGFAEAPYKKNSTTPVKFFHLGKNNNWKNILDKKIVREIELTFKKEMEELGYL